MPQIEAPMMMLKIEVMAVESQVCSDYLWTQEIALQKPISTPNGCKIQYLRNLVKSFLNVAYFDKLLDLHPYILGHLIFNRPA